MKEADASQLEDGKDIVITLQWYEMSLAANVGTRRHLISLRDGLKNAHGYEGIDNWTMDIEGAAAEMAVAKLLNRYWDGSVNTFKSPDLSGSWQVRWTQRGDGRLIVRPKDSDSDRYVLVTGCAPTYVVIGWIEGRFAKNPAWLKSPNDRPPAYFIPQSELRPLPRKERP